MPFETSRNSSEELLKNNSSAQPRIANEDVLVQSSERRRLTRTNSAWPADISMSMVSLSNSKALTATRPIPHSVTP